jgi:L,D-transpeptidase catalytic domain
MEASLGGLAIAASLAAPALGQSVGVDNRIAPTLLQRALNALELHHNRIAYRDYIGVIDFSLPSRVPRFHVVTLGDLSARSHLVAHGRGSDPSQTGWLERFSNDPHSNATSAGAYRTADIYVGAHGPSIRLEGLDPTNDNALSRAIVVHAACVTP